MAQRTKQTKLQSWSRHQPIHLWHMSFKCVFATLQYSHNEQLLKVLSTQELPLCRGNENIPALYSLTPERLREPFSSDRLQLAVTMHLSFV